MRILFLDFNFNYINKNRTLLVEMFKRIPDCFVFGPGYLENEIISKGLSSYIDKQGPFDIVVATEHVTVFPFWNSQTSYKDWERSYHFGFPKEQLYPYAKEFYNYFSNFPGIKIASFLESDYYNFSEERGQILERMGAYILGWGPEFLENIQNIQDLMEDSFTKKANNHWRNFLLRNPEKVLSCPFFVDKNEFSRIGLQDKKYDWSVVGADYYNRRTVRAILSNNGIKWCGKGIIFLFALMNKLKINPYNKKWCIKLFNFLFKKVVESTRFSYTDGSRLHYLVRKYLEIPALGSVLVCDKCMGFSNFGFIDGENAIICEPKNIISLHQKLKKNLGYAQTVAKNGQDLIFKNHTLDARLEQIKSCLHAIFNNNFSGSYWKEGQFVVKKQIQGNIIHDH